MLSTIGNASKPTQNCPKLPKFAQKWNFEIPPKIKILVFLKNKNLYMNFKKPLCAKRRFFQGSMNLMNMRFCWHVPTSPKNKNLKSLNPYLL